MSERVLKTGESRCRKCGKPRYIIERCCDVYAQDGELPKMRESSK